MRESNYHKQIRNCLAFITVIVFLLVMKVTATLMIPVAIAILIFALVNPVVGRLTRLRVPNLISIILVMALVIFVILVIIYASFSMVNVVIGKMPYYYARVISLDKQLSLYITQYDSNLPEDFSFLNSLNYDWYGLLMSGLTSVSSKAVSIIGDVFIIILTLLFMLLERTSFMPKVFAALSREKGNRLTVMMNRINRQITKYLFLKIIISAATGILFYLSALITGLDFPMVWGIAAFILNFIPNIGSIIATVLTILMAMIQFSPRWAIILYVALLNTSIEIVLGNIIDPRLQGVQLNLSPLVILLSLSLWGFIWGIPGMFLAVPLTSMLQIMFANIPTLRPLAIMFSSGKAYVRAEKSNEWARRNSGSYSSAESSYYSGVVLPEGHNRYYESGDED